MDRQEQEANKALARRFIEALNHHDLGEMQALLHEDFVWNTAVTADDGPNEFRPMQSELLKGKNLPHAKPRLNRQESLTVLATMFGGQYDDAMKAGSESAAAGHKPAPARGAENRIRMDILGLTAEADRVAMEAESHIRNPENGRLYNNFYHHLFRFRDGKIVLFKEYQDTLHLFDFVTP